MSRNNHTVRNNVFDYECTKQTPIYIDENGIEHSLNKNNNWELLNDPNIKQIKYHRGIEGDHENSAITDKQPWSYGGGRVWSKYKKGRDYVTVDGQRQNADFKINEQKNCIILPFCKNEYPIDREPHTNYSSQCMCCFWKDGRIWQLKGLGEKSLNKNKGMKRENQRDLKFYNDYQINIHKC